METPVQSEKVREKAHQLCKEYLQVRGSWASQPPPRARGRGWPPSSSTSARSAGGSPTWCSTWACRGARAGATASQGASFSGRGSSWALDQLSRLFGELSQTAAHQYRMITETVVFTMLAERNLGPRLFGVFPGGRLEEFIPGHPLTTGEMRSNEFSGQIARNVALVHSLEVPVSKEPTWLQDTMRTYLHRLTICPDKVGGGEAPVHPGQVPEEEREHAEVLARWDVRQEVRVRQPAVLPQVEWLLAFLKTVDSPVVFSHNDINTGNILVRADPASWDPVVFIDYEFAAYNHRAFDIANHFNEWMYDYGRKVRARGGNHNWPGLPLLLPQGRPVPHAEGAGELDQVGHGVLHHLLQDVREDLPGAAAAAAGEQRELRLSAAAPAGGGESHHEGGDGLLPGLPHGVVPLGAEAGGCQEARGVTPPGPDLLHTLRLLPLRQGQAGGLQGGQGQGSHRHIHLVHGVFDCKSCQ